MIESGANILSAIAAAIAGIYWFLSTKALVAPEPQDDPGGRGSSIGRTIVTSIGKTRVDLIKTIILQSRQNAIAASFACLAAACQVIAILAKTFTWP